MIERWLEVEQGFMHDAPKMMVKVKGKWQYVEDPDAKPSNAWFLVRKCMKDKRGHITRIRAVKHIECSDWDDLDEKMLSLLNEPGTILLPMTEQL